jgi:hypothetical protein
MLEQSATRIDLFVIPSYSDGQTENALHLAEIAAEHGFTPVIVCNGARTTSALANSSHALFPGTNTGYGGAANFVAQDRDFDTLVLCNDDLFFTSGAMRTLRSAVDRLNSVSRPSIMGFLPQVRPRVFPIPSFLGVIAIVSGLSALTGRLRAKQSQRRHSLPPTAVVGEDEVLPEGWAFPFVCVAITRKAWDVLGGFDTRFPLYFEDMDVLARAHRAVSLRVSFAIGDCAHSRSSSTRAVLPYALPLMSVGGRNYLELHCNVPKAIANVLITSALAIRIMFWLPIRPNRKAEVAGIVRSVRSVWSSQPTPMPPW